jgi:hypothetical protein
VKGRGGKGNGDFKQGLNNFFILFYFIFYFALVIYFRFYNKFLTN